MMYGEDFVEGKGAQLTRVRDLLIGHLMDRGQNIVVDNTNLHPDRESEYRLLVEEFNATNTKLKYEIEIKDFTNVPLSTCLKRNKERERKVPEFVIKKMHKDYIAPFIKKPTQDGLLPKAIIVDIDGTIADINHRGPYEQTKVLLDKPIHAICDLVRLYAASGFIIIYLSGREEPCRNDTLTWLKKHQLPEGLLLLNKKGEKRSSAITKLEIFNENILGKYYIYVVLEDRWKNIEAWNSIGLMTLMVGSDDNFF